MTIELSLVVKNCIDKTCIHLTYTNETWNNQGTSHLCFPKYIQGLDQSRLRANQGPNVILLPGKYSRNSFR